MEETGSTREPGNLQDPREPHARTTLVDEERPAGTAVQTGATSLSGDKTGPAGETIGSYFSMAHGAICVISVNPVLGTDPRIVLLFIE